MRTYELQGILNSRFTSIPNVEWRELEVLNSKGLEQGKVSVRSISVSLATASVVSGPAIISTPAMAQETVCRIRWTINLCAGPTRII